MFQTKAFHLVIKSELIASALVVSCFISFSYWYHECESPSVHPCSASENADNSKTTLNIWIKYFIFISFSIVQLLVSKMLADFAVHHFDPIEVLK